MSMCTGISNGINDVKFEKPFVINGIQSLTTINDTAYHQNVSLYNSFLGYYNHWLNITTNINNNNMSENMFHNFSNTYCNPFTIPNNLLYLNFESFQYLFFDKQDLIFNNDMYYVNNEFSFGSKYDYYYDLKIVETAHFPLFPLYLGRAYLITYKPTIFYEKSYGRLIYLLDLNLQLEQLNIQLESNEIRLKIFPHKLSIPGIVKFETTRKYDCKYIQYILLCLLI
jgi:hypothetical protein